jgi:hypothetical protein
MTDAERQAVHAMIEEADRLTALSNAYNVIRALNAENETLRSALDEQADTIATLRRLLGPSADEAEPKEDA